MLDLEVQNEGRLAEALENPRRFINFGEPRKDVNIRIVRNWPAEPVTNKIKDFGKLAGMDIAIELSPYSDSLMLEKESKETFQVCVFWLDEDRLSDQALHELHESAVEIARSRPYVSFCMLRPGDSGEFKNAPTNLTLSYCSEAELAPESELKYGHRFASPEYVEILREISIATVPNACFGPIGLLPLILTTPLTTGFLGRTRSMALRFPPKELN